MNLIEKHIEIILEKYTKGEYYDILLKAKAEYIRLTGKLNEDTDEYESRMNNFNDWYIFHYIKNDERKIIDEYIQDFDLDPDLAKAFYNVNFSIFHYEKKSFRGFPVFKDILHSKKFVIGKENGNLSVVIGDLFLARIVTYSNEYYLLRGFCSLPHGILAKVAKESKQVRKMNNVHEEEIFLLKLEQLKTKSLNYGHIDANKIFIFN